MGNFSFGNYICGLREKKGLSQSQLGERLGVTNKAVSRWENGGAYPSTELMLPLAKELGITIEELYRAISDDKAPKTKSRKLLEHLARRSKIITIICLAASAIPYILFLCLSTAEYKLPLAIITPIVALIVYFMVRFIFFLARKNPFAPSKWTDTYTMFFLGIMALGFLAMLATDAPRLPNGFHFSLCVPPIAFMSTVHTLKGRYK